MTIDFNPHGQGWGSALGRGFAVLTAVSAITVLSGCGQGPTEPDPTPAPVVEAPPPADPPPADPPAETVAIRLFVADPSAIDAGGSSTLRWDVANATAVEIDQGIGNVSLSGTRGVSPAVTTTYTLTAHGAGGDATATTEVRINAAAPVCVPTLTSPADGATLDNGRYDGQDRLSWGFNWSDCAGATRYDLHVSRGSFIAISKNDIGSSSHIFSRETYYADLTGWSWKVRAMVGGTWGEWSPARSFRLEPVQTDSAPLSSMRAEINYYRYDSATRWITFRVRNTGDAWLECVEADIVGTPGGARLYGPEYSNRPFFSTPTTPAANREVLPSGQTVYLRYQLRTSPGALGIRATFKVYSVDNKGGPIRTYTVTEGHL